MGCCLTCFKQLTGGSSHSYSSIDDRYNFEEVPISTENPTSHSPTLSNKPSSNNSKNISLKPDSSDINSSSSLLGNVRSSTIDSNGSSDSLILSSSQSSTSIDTVPKSPVRDPFEAVYSGTVVLQKFSKEEKYDRKFIWINPKNVTIHMSQHSAKDKSHKEAGLRDVTSVICGPPSKLTTPPTHPPPLSPPDPPLNGSGTHGTPPTTTPRGGIDLVFQNKNIRDMWHACLVEILQFNGGSAEAASDVRG
jgi:hypothetical protein